MRNVVAAAVLAVVAAFCCRAAQKTDVAREWESSGRTEALCWFTRSWFGVRPVERPADEKISRDSVSFAGGRKKIRVRLFLPKGAGKANPVPVCVHADHFNPSQSAGDVSQMGQNSLRHFRAGQCPGIRTGDVARAAAIGKRTVHSGFHSIGFFGHVQ